MFCIFSIIVFEYYDYKKEKMDTNHFNRTRALTPAQVVSITIYESKRMDKVLMNLEKKDMIEFVYCLNNFKREAVQHFSDSVTYFVVIKLQDRTYLTFDMSRSSYPPDHKIYIFGWRGVWSTYSATSDCLWDWALDHDLVHLPFEKTRINK